MLGLKDFTLLLPPAVPLQVLKAAVTRSSAVKCFENYVKEGKRNRTKKQHQGCAFWVLRVNGAAVSKSCFKQRLTQTCKMTFTWSSGDVISKFKKK